MFKDMLKYLRTRDGYSQAELATRLGLSKSAISMYEIGNRQPDIETLEVIVDFFNVDMNFLLGKSSDKNIECDYYNDSKGRKCFSVTVGENIKYWRELRNMKQSDLADKLNVSDKTVSSWEINRTEPKIGLVQKICSVLNCKTSDIIGENEQYISKEFSELKPDKKTLLDCYDKLNLKGKNKLLDSAQDMICSPIYNNDYEIELKAAHERTDLEITDEMIEADNAIMDDGNF